MNPTSQALSSSAGPAPRSAHARYAQHVARRLGLGFRSLDGEDGYLFEVSDGARRAVFAAGAGSPYALNDARAASIARDKAFCAETLRQAELPTLEGRMFFVTPRWAELRAPGREPADALAFAANASYPLFCKPISGSCGQYAEVIADAAEFAAYMGRVAREHFAILVQDFVRAPEHRVLVLDGRALCAYRKTPPSVVGDGKATLLALARGAREAVVSSANLRGRDAAGGLVAAEAVVPRGAVVVLEGPANRAVGGGVAAFVRETPAPLAQLACAAAAALGLRFAGVDLFDLSADGDHSALTVIEVNSNPMIATLEEQDAWDLIEIIWRANFDAALK